VLEKAEERVRLLKTGFTGKEIEILYIKNNNIKIVLSPEFLDLIEID
jgi:hypothetical protein